MNKGALAAGLLACVNVQALENVAPRSIAIRADQQASFFAHSISESPVTYDWIVNGALAGSSKDGSLTISGRSLGTAPWLIQVRATNNAGSRLGDAFTVYRYERPFGSAMMTGISSLSVRAAYYAFGQPLTLGFAISGSDELPVLVRSAGGELTNFGIDAVVEDPSLYVYQNGELILFNNDWAEKGLGQYLAAISRQVGAFPYTNPYGKDSSLCFIAKNQRTIQVKPYSGSLSNGVVLLEAYSCANSESSRFVNGSILHNVGIDSETLILGFSISGIEKSTKVLIRGIGPSLALFGISNCLSNPRLELHGAKDGVDTILSSNQGWGGSQAMQDAFASVGAFSLTSKSADAALILSLSAGTYSVLLSGAGASTGVGLIEIYELP